MANCGICSWYVLVFEIISVLFFYCGIAYVPYSTMQFAAIIIFLIIFMMVDYIQVPAKE